MLIDGAPLEMPAAPLHDLLAAGLAAGADEAAMVSAEEGDLADLIVFCRERVGYKAPEEVVVLDEMPLNPTAKIDRVGLKKMAEDHLHPHGLA